MEWANKQAMASTVPSTVELGEMRVPATASKETKDDLSNNEQPAASNAIERQGLINPSNQPIPKSILIEAIDQASKQEIQTVAPNVSNNLKRFLKIPLISELSLAGIQAGMTSVSSKWLSELIVQFQEEHREITLESGSENLLLVYSIIILAISAPLQIYFLNRAIALYAQKEVIATYQVTVMIFTILCGLILVDEDEEYSSEGYVFIPMSVALMIAGILVLFCKNN